MRELTLVNKENVTGLYPHLSRAFEIALVGDFKILLKTVKSEDPFKKFASENDLRVLANIFEDSVIKGLTHIFLFESEYDSSRELKNIVLTIEIDQVDISTLFSARKYESLETVIERAENGKINFKVDSNLSESCKAFLKTAYERIGELDLIKLDSIVQVAQTIAQLHGAKEIKFEYLAEAIQYHSV